MPEHNKSKLPKEWIWIKLGDIFQIVRGISFPKDARVNEPRDGFVGCLRTANVQREVVWDDLWFVSRGYVKRDEQWVQENDILISTANSLELVGKVALVKQLPFVSTLGAFISLIRIPKGYNPKFFYYQISSEEVQSEFRKKASTTTNISNLSTKKVKDTWLKLPPLSEQNRIIEKIEELFTQLDAGIAELQTAKAQLQRYRQAVLKSAVEGELTREWREEHKDKLEPADVLLERILSERRTRWEAEGGKGNYKEPVPPGTDDLPELPEGWVWTSLGQLLEKIEAGKSFKAEGRPAESNEYGVIKVSAMSWGKFLPNENKALFPNTDISRSSPVKAGDLLISRANTVELVGAVVLVERDHPNLLLSDKSLRLVLTSREIEKRYVLYSLRSHWVRNVYERLATGTSDSMRNLSQTKIKAAPIALPSREEQIRIADKVERRLSVTDEIERQLDQALTRAERMRQSILKCAFEGKLVEQNPQDEPASVMS
jgi:type I restriction enzyme S subunit